MSIDEGDDRGFEELVMQELIHATLTGGPHVRQRACTEVETDAMLADLHNAQVSSCSLSVFVPHNSSRLTLGMSFQDSEEGELGALRFLLNRMATAQLRWCSPLHDTLSHLPIRPRHPYCA